MNTPADPATEPAQSSATDLPVTLPEGQEPSPEPATPDDTAADTSSAIAEPDSGRPSRAQARIEEQAAEKLALREAAEYWRNRALAQAEPKPTPAPEKQAPKFADFDSADDWAAAHAAFVEERADARAQQAAQTRFDNERSNAAAEATRTAFEAREAEFEKTVQGYKEAVSNPSLRRYATPTIGEVIQTSDNGPALSFHLAMNPDKLARIARLTPAQQAASLGRLEAELISKPAPKIPKKASTNAPAPPTPVGGSQPSKGIGEMSIDEYMAHRAHGRRVIS